MNVGAPVQEDSLAVRRGRCAENGHGQADLGTGVVATRCIVRWGYILAGRLVLQLPWAVFLEVSLFVAVPALADGTARTVLEHESSHDGLDDGGEARVGFGRRRRGGRHRGGVGHVSRGNGGLALLDLELADHQIKGPALFLRLFGVFGPAKMDREVA